MTLSFTAATRDSLSNLAASLNAGKDKSRGDGFFLFDLDRSQVEAMYRGDWLARKVVDIVPYDMVREWRVWSGDRADVAAAEAAERRFGLRKLVQRALTLGRLYGGAAIVVGTGEEDPAALACELVPDWIRPGGIKFLHGVSRWQLGAEALCRDPLSPWFGEPEAYEITAPGRGALRLHPSRVIRFLGNELPDPSTGLSVWSDSVLQTLYDAIHAVALTTTGATSLMHEAKVDIVTVPNLSEHLSSAATTAQLSARFAYAAAMKSINNLLLLGDGETWSRQTVDFGGLPEMVRTFLQVAAGAADIPVTRLLGQSPAGMSATGESDTRNYYDHVSARQELDLRPQLERLDALLLRSAGVDPSALTFEFRPLWQMDVAASAAIALQKAQATRIYAGLNLWPASVTAKLVQAQFAEDGTYPGAEGIFAEVPPAPAPTTDFDPAQPRDPDGRWTSRGGANAAPGTDPSAAVKTHARNPLPSPAEPKRESLSVASTLLNLLNPIGPASAQEIDPEEENRGLAEESLDPTEPIRIQGYVNARNALKEIDPDNRELRTLSPPNYIPSEVDVTRIEAAARAASIQRVCDFAFPNGQPIGQPGTSPNIRELPGGLAEANKAFDYMSAGGVLQPFKRGVITRLPGDAGYITLRPVTSTPESLLTSTSLAFRAPSCIIEGKMRDVAKVLAELRNEADIDFVDLPHIASVARYDLGFESEEDIRRCSLEIVKGLMERGVYPGDYDYADQIEFWHGTVVDHVKRIEAEWIAMGKTPTLAEPICWFALKSSENA